LIVAEPETAELRMLILEDVPEDAELAERALRNGDISFRTRRVATRADFLEALESFRPGLIIVDYNLPDIDGLAAVSLVRERDTEVPILLVTGVLEDEAAVEVIKAGANDYVRKDRLARLPLAVKNALAAAAALRQRREAMRALQESAREIEDLYNNAPCGYHSLDQDSVFVRINNTELDWLGYAREDMVGKRKFSDLLTPKSRSIFEASLSQFKAEGCIRDIEFDLIRRNGDILPVLLGATASTDAGGNYLMSRSIVYDMTERRRVEEQLRRENRAHRALSMCNEALVRATDESALLHQICRIVNDEAGHLLCWVGYAEQDAARTVRPIAQAGFNDGYLKVANITWDDSERGRGPTGTCIRSGLVQIARDIATDPRFAPWRVDALQRGYASSIAIPLLAEGNPFAALTIYSAEIDAFEDAEVKLLTELANDLAYGIMSLRTQAERKRAEAEEVIREREAAIGFKIQQILLLDEPPQDVSGLRLAAITVPSRHIAGDFYEFFTHHNQCLDVIVADVMGKGIPAALLGAATKSHFIKSLCQLIARSQDGALPEPRDIVTLAHAGMARHLIELDTFVTVCYARVDLSHRCLDLVDCGHTGVVRARPGTDLCEIIHGDNLPLGIREGEIYNQVAVPFEMGDVFVFYSDGITEACDAAGELFGVNRLIAAVRKYRHRAPNELVDAIRASVLAFSRSDLPADDLTCVAVEAGERCRLSPRRKIDIRSDLRELSLAREFVRAFCCTIPGSPLTKDRVAELELAVNEAASNVMKHAYHGRDDQQIHLEAEAFPDCVEIRLHHLGDPFDPSAVVLPSFDGSRESGFGTYLLASSVDDVRYSRGERDHSITIVKLY
jgi:PAS domain S-box-containing protein